MRRLLIGLMSFLLLAVLGVWIVSSGPNFEISLKRELPRTAPLPQIKSQIAELEKWKSWHIGLENAQAPLGLKPGAGLILTFKPKRLSTRPRVLDATIIDYDPMRGISFILTSESNQKILKLFRSVRWDYAWDDRSVFVQVTATTLSARGRFFGRIAPRVILNQILYADLHRFAGEKPPEYLPLLPN